MRNRIFKLVFAVAFLALSACAESTIGPDNDTLKTALHSQISDWNKKRLDPTDFSIQGLEVIEVENIGSEVEPQIKGRYVAILSLNNPLYESVERVELPDGRFVGTILREVRPTGFHTDVSGVYEAKVLSRNKDSTFWDISIKLDDVKENKWVGAAFELFPNPTREGSDQAIKIREAREVAISEAAQKEREREQADQLRRATLARNTIGTYTTEGPIRTTRLRTACGGFNKGDRVPLHMKVVVPEGTEVNKVTPFTGELFVPGSDELRVSFSGEVEILYKKKRWYASPGDVFWTLDGKHRLTCKTESGREISLGGTHMGYFGKAGGDRVNATQEDTYGKAVFVKR